jgi:hypothetical protein
MIIIIIKILAALSFILTGSSKKEGPFIVFLIVGIYLLTKIPHPGYLTNIHELPPFILKVICGFLFVIAGDETNNPDGPPDDNFGTFLAFVAIGTTLLLIL